MAVGASLLVSERDALWSQTLLAPHAKPVHAPAANTASRLLLGGQTKPEPRGVKREKEKKSASPRRIRPPVNAVTEREEGAKKRIK